MFSLSAFFAGFLISLSLILAIGAQNTFVLRQGLKRQHILPLILFCAVSDAFLICLGVLGLGALLEPIFQKYADFMLCGAALWLGGYGVLRLREAARSSVAALAGDAVSSLKLVLSTAAILTFANPHVYLDTIVLIGTLSSVYAGEQKGAFALGAMSASFVFFTALGYGATLLSPLMSSVRSWRIVDVITGLLMLGFAAIMLSQTSWLAGFVTS